MLAISSTKLQAQSQWLLLVAVRFLTDFSRIKTGLLYRSARPDEASFQDRQRLLRDYGVKSIIDLRTKSVMFPQHS